MTRRALLEVSSAVYSPALHAFIRDQVKQSPLFLENTARKEASQAQAVASGQQAHEQVQATSSTHKFIRRTVFDAWRRSLFGVFAMQRAALREDSMAVEEQPPVASAAGASGIAAMDVDIGSKSK